MKWGKDTRMNKKKKTGNNKKKNERRGIEDRKWNVQETGRNRINEIVQQ